MGSKLIRDSPGLVQGFPNRFFNHPVSRLASSRQLRVLVESHLDSAVGTQIDSRLGGGFEQNPVLKNMTSSIGMIIETQYFWKNKMDVPNQQPGLVGIQLVSYGTLIWHYK